MTEERVVQVRRVGLREPEQARKLLAGHLDWRRRQLSQELVTLWGWRNGVGQLKDMAARTLMLKLEHRGGIALAPWRQVPPTACGKSGCTRWNRRRPHGP